MLTVFSMYSVYISSTFYNVQILYNNVWARNRLPQLICDVGGVVLRLPGRGVVLLILDLPSRC